MKNTSMTCLLLHFYNCNVIMSLFLIPLANTFYLPIFPAPAQKLNIFTLLFSLFNVTFESLNIISAGGFKVGLIFSNHL